MYIQNDILPSASVSDFGVAQPDGETLTIEDGVLSINNMPYKAILDDNTQAQISAASTAGVAADLQSVGDCKKITLNGTVGTLNLDNYDTYVFILGFDHNASVEGYGISFGCFKTAKISGIDVALCDDAHGTKAGSAGEKKFTLNHQGNSFDDSYNNYNYGGWKGCDARYDLLGSTDSAPADYGSLPITSRAGYDASNTTATSPVANTLMAALPSDLRAVMKPITKYSENKGGGASGERESFTSSIDYLPLLSEYEIYGVGEYASRYESYFQRQYTYYTNGNSKIKYNHSSTSNVAYWWCRSANGAYFFCCAGNESASRGSSQYSLGLSPVFLV